MVTPRKPARPVAGVIIGLAVLAIILAAGLSIIRAELWHSPEEELPDLTQLSVSAEQTLGELAATPPYDARLISKTFQRKLPDAGATTIAELGLSGSEATAMLRKSLALRAEQATKDFQRIFIKFALWFALLPVPVVLLYRRKLGNRLRLGLLAAGALIFGAILGSDPSPMGTVKDAVYLYGSSGAVFIPRMIALAVFLAMVIAANKLICSWGCQFGTLQEFIFRLNRRSHKPRSSLPVVRIPFKAANTVRVVFFAVFTVVAFVWAFDLIGPIDPFKVYNPLKLTLSGIVFIAALLVASLFVYRPWCTLACPFGLVSWLTERLSIIKPRVDYGKCIACHACEQACPSDAMRGLLRRHGLPQDCFSCGDCIAVCPTQAVAYRGPGGGGDAEVRLATLAKLKAESQAEG